MRINGLIQLPAWKFIEQTFKLASQCLPGAPQLRKGRQVAGIGESSYPARGFNLKPRQAQKQPYQARPQPREQANLGQPLFGQHLFLHVLNNVGLYKEQMMNNLRGRPVPGRRDFGAVSAQGFG